MSEVPRRRSAAPAAPMAPDPARTTPLTRLYDGAGDQPPAFDSERTARKWASDLPAHQAQQWGRGKSWHVARDARLPSGQTVDAYLRCGPLPTRYRGWSLPADFHEHTAKRQAKVRAIIELLGLLDEVEQRFPLHKTAEQRAKLIEALHSDFLKEHGLSADPQAVARYKRKLRDGKMPDLRGRPSKSNGDAWWAQRAEAMYLDAREWSAAKIYRQLCGEAAGRELPSVKTVERHLKSIPRFFADYRRRGRKRWAADHLPRFDRSAEDFLAFEHWEGDHARCDFWALGDKGQPVRLFITAWIDRRTRLLVGWCFSESPYSGTILAAARRGILRWGAPNQGTIDNGMDYRALTVAGGRPKAPRDDSAEDQIRGTLGVVIPDLRFTEPERPTSKGLIESSFNFTHADFDRAFPSYCGRDVEHRPETITADLRRGRVPLPTKAEVEALFEKWVEGVYHRKPHTAEDMRGLSPLEAAAQFEAIPKRTAPERSLDILLAMTRRAKVTRRGVRYNRVNYGAWADALLPLQGQEVQLRIDPADASYIVVYKLSGEFVAVAGHDRLRGVTQDDVRKGIREQRRIERLAREYGKVSGKRWLDTTDHAIEVAVRGVQEQARRRVASGGGRGVAGGEVAPPAPRNLELLPGADEAAKAARAVDARRGGAAEPERRFLDIPDMGVPVEPERRLLDIPDCDPDGDETFGRACEEMAERERAAQAAQDAADDWDVPVSDWGWKQASAESDGGDAA